MDGLFPQFPYTNFHGQNLDWYIHKVVWLLHEVHRLRKYIDEELQKVRGEVKEALEEWERRLAQIEANISAQLEDLKKQTQEILEDAEKQFKDFIAAQQKILDDFKDWIEANNYKIKAYVDFEIQKLKDLINAPIEGPVFNYFRQETTPIQLALYDYYNHLRVHAYTAKWFDAAGMTAQELDNLDKTALNWDIEGKHIIKDYRKWWPWWAFSPYTGLRETTENLIYQLFQYHGVGLTTEMWDDLGYTAGTFDNSGYNAFQLDWTNAPMALGN